MKIVHFTSCALIFIIISLFFFDASLAQTDANQPVKSTQILQTQTTWNGADLSYLDSGTEEITALKIEFATGAETDWHRHPVASLAYIISGELEVILKDSNESRIFRKGDAFAEVINTWHYGKNIGDEPVELIVFYVGEKGIQLTELLSEPEIK